MGRRIVDVDAPDRFVAGDELAGEDDGCYIEVVRSRRRMSVSVEREQLARLADGLLMVVDELERRGLVAIEIGAADPAPDRPARRQAFRAETLTIEWDDDGHRVVVEARSPEPGTGAGESAPWPHATLEEDIEDVPDDAPLGPDVLRIRLTPHMAQRFARQAGRVAGGRAPGPHGRGGTGGPRPGG